MNDATVIGRRIIRVADEAVNLFVLTAVLLLLVFGCYAVWDSNQVADDASAERYATYKPSAAKGGKSFHELQVINSDVFGWLTVYGTNVDYPLVQGKDNMVYITTSAEGKHSISGAIFLDSKSSKDFTDFNSIIYGHHMARRVMFGDIGLFGDQQFFDDHRYGKLYYGGIEHGIEFFAFISCDAYDSKVFNPSVQGLENQQDYLDMLLNMALFKRNDVPVTTNDHLVMLATCSNILTNGRSLLVGKITNKVVDDPFKLEAPVNNNLFPAISAVQGIWAEAPIWAKVMVIALLLLLIALLISYIYKRTQRRTRYQERRNIRW